MLNNAPFWFFFNEETEALINEIKSGNITFPARFWGTISDEGTSSHLFWLRCWVIVGLTFSHPFSERLHLSASSRG
jgi:hypothetical protein